MVERERKGGMAVVVVLMVVVLGRRKGGMEERRCRLRLLARYLSRARRAAVSNTWYAFFSLFYQLVVLNIQMSVYFKYLLV